MASKTIRLTPTQETQLIGAIAAAFAAKPFDATSIASEAEHNAALAAALDAIIPHCWYSSGFRKNRFSSKPIRRALNPLPQDYFDTDTAGWWSIKPDDDTDLKNGP